MCVLFSQQWTYARLLFKGVSLYTKTTSMFTAGAFLKMLFFPPCFTSSNGNRDGKTLHREFGTTNCSWLADDPCVWCYGYFFIESLIGDDMTTCPALKLLLDHCSLVDAMTLCHVLHVLLENNSSLTTWYYFRFCSSYLIKVHWSIAPVFTSWQNVRFRTVYVVLLH